MTAITTDGPLASLADAARAAHAAWDMTPTVHSVEVHVEAMISALITGATTNDARCFVAILTETANVTGRPLAEVSARDVARQVATIICPNAVQHDA